MALIYVHTTTHLVEQPHGMNAKARHEAIALGDAHVVEEEGKLRERERDVRVRVRVPEWCGSSLHLSLVMIQTDHVAALWVVREEVHDAPGLLLMVPGVGLEGVDHIGELHPIADEEDGHVVSHLPYVMMIMDQGEA